MKLKEYNADNCVGSSRRDGKPCISIDTKVGTLRLNRELCELAGLKEGAQVKFHQDQEEENEWYLEKVETGGFALRAAKGTNGVHVFNSTPLAKAIAESVSFTDRSGKMLVAGKPTEFNKRKLFGVLTSTLRNK